MNIIPERKTKNLTEYAMVHKNVQQARQRASTALTRHRDRWRTKIMKLTNQKTAYPAWQNFNRFTKQEKFVESVPPNEFETLIPRYSENCFLASKALDDKNFFPFKPYVKPIATNSTLTLIGSRENDVFEKLSELSFVLNSQNLVRLIGTGPLKKRSTFNSSADCRKKNNMFQELEASVQDAQKLQEEEEKNMDISKLHNKIKLNGQLNICKNSPEKNAEFKVSPQTSPRKQKIRTPAMMQKNNPITFNVSQFVSQIKRASAEGTRGQISIEDYDGCLAPSVGIGQIQCKQKANKYRRGKIQKKRRAPKWVYFTPTTCVVRPSRSAKIQVSTVKHVQSRRRKRKAALKGYPLDFVRSVVSCFPRKRIFTKGKVKYEKATPLDISYLKTKRLKPSNARKLQKDKFSCFTACGWYRAQLRNLANRTKPVALPPYDKKKEKFDPYRRRLIPKCQYKPIPMPVDFKIPLTPKWNVPVPSNYEEIRQNYTKYMHKRHDIRIRKEYNFHWNEYIEPRQTKYQDTQFRKPELYSPVS